MNKFISLIVISICFVMSACDSKSTQKSSPSFIEGTYENNSLNYSRSYTFSSDGSVVLKQNTHTFPATKYHIEGNIIKGENGNVLDLVIQTDGSIGNPAIGRYVKK